MVLTNDSAEKTNDSAFQASFSAVRISVSSNQSNGVKQQ